MTLPRWTLPSLVALVLTTGATASTPTPRATAHALALEATVHAEALESLKDQVTEEAVREAMHRRLAQLDGTLEALERILADERIAIPTQVSPIPFVPPTVQAQVHLAGPATHVQIELKTEPEAVETVATVAMDEAGLSRLLTALEEEAFSDARLGILRSAINAPSGFDMDQAIRILEAFDFGSDKVEAAAMLYPCLVDGERWYEIYGAFDFDTDKDALRSLVAE